MFKKFAREDVSTSNQVKASIQRGIRAKILEAYPILEETHAIDVILPKKESAVLAKWTLILLPMLNADFATEFQPKIPPKRTLNPFCPDRTQVLVLNNRPLFFNHRDGPWFPTLRLLHQYPDMMKKVRVDQGAIKFVLSGANIMCPGLTSAGATIHDEADADVPVAIYAEGKQHATAVGVTKMSTADIRSINKGIGIDTMHYLNDGLWKTDDFS